MNEIPKNLEEIHWQACGLECPVVTGGKCKKDSGKWCTGPKFDSAAAEILHDWSMDSGQDDESGHSDYGNGWHALFRQERAILHTDSQGFVYAWQVPDSEDIDKVWEGIEEGAVYPDDDFENGSPSCTEDDPCVVCYNA